MILSVLWLDSESPFQTVGAVKEKRRTAVLVCDLDTVSIFKHYIIIKQIENISKYI